MPPKRNTVAKKSAERQTASRASAVSKARSQPKAGPKSDPKRAGRRAAAAKRAVAKKAAHRAWKADYDTYQSALKQARATRKATPDTEIYHRYHTTRHNLTSGWRPSNAGGHYEKKLEEATKGGERGGLGLQLASGRQRALMDDERKASKAGLAAGQAVLKQKRGGGRKDTTRRR